MNDFEKWWNDKLNDKDFRFNMGCQYVWSDEEFKKLEALLRKGKLVRKNVQDPELIIMDADSPETIQLVLDDMSYLERRWYVFEPENKQALLDLLMEISE